MEPSITNWLFGAGGAGALLALLKWATARKQASPPPVEFVLGSSGSPPAPRRAFWMGRWLRWGSRVGSANLALLALQETHRIALDQLSRAKEDQMTTEADLRVCRAECRRLRLLLAAGNGSSAGSTPKAGARRPRKQSPAASPKSNG